MRNIRIKVCLLKDIPKNEIGQAISKLMFFGMEKEPLLQRIHKAKGFKGYSLQGELYSEEKMKIDQDYEEEETYNFNIKCLSDEAAEAFIRALTGLENEEMMVVDVDSYRIREGNIESLYTLTPAVATLKDKNGKIISWVKDLGIEVLENQLFNNILKKYNQINGINLSIPKEDIIEKIEIKNNYPIKLKYKNGIALGYKYQVYFKDNMIAQQLANFTNIVGILGKNSNLGCGFVKANYKRQVR